MIDLKDGRTQLLLGAAAGASATFWLVRRGTTSSPGTDFDCYLRNKEVGRSQPQPDRALPYAATSFDAYLRQPVAAAAATATATDAPTPAAAPDTVTAASGAREALAAAKPVTVLFGTEFGFSKEVAERVCERLRQANGGGGGGASGGSSGYWPQLLDMADLTHGLPGLAQQQQGHRQHHQALLLVCSTQGDGVPPAEARDFCEWLAGGGAPQLDGLPFSVCALGDRSYQHFCRCGRSLDERLAALGGARLAPCVDVNREDWKAIDSWLEAVLEALEKLPLKTVAELGGGNPMAAAAGAGAGTAAAAPTKRWSKSQPYMGRVVAVEGLCTLSSQEDKNTVRVEVDLGDSGLQYVPGDALGVWPTNCPQAVGELLEAVGSDGSLAVQVPAWHYQDAQLAPAGAGSMPMRDALSRCYDLRQPKVELLQLLHAKLAAAADAAAAANEQQAEALAQAQAQPLQQPGNGQQQQQKPGRQQRVFHITADGQQAGKAAAGKQAAGKAGGKLLGKQQHTRGLDSASELSSGPAAAAMQHEALCSKGCLADKLEQLATLVGDPVAAEQYLAPRHVIDVLLDFQPASLAPAELLGALRQLQPRLYSISSSQLEHPQRVQATVAIVRYSSLSCARLGVCSTFLAERLEVGRALPIYIHKNPDFRLPVDPATPIIMVGPGTGLAPFRAFMQERITRAAQAGTAGSLGQSVLYFGCRRRDQDFLYGPLLEGWASVGKLKLYTAFSRQQARKVYVLDRLAESAGLVWQLLQSGAHFYVCGDASSMAGAVEQQLLAIIQGGQQQGAAAAARYLRELAQAGRYQRDVWLS